MAENEGDRTNNDAADAGGTGEGGGMFEGDGLSEPGGGSAIHSEEAAGTDPAGFDPGNAGGTGEGGGARSRPGDWNPNEHSGGGGGEVY
jgi:hypothetical protein